VGLETPRLPLAVDLDGTLFRGDLFIESILRYVFAAPWRVFTLIFWLMRGRAYAKARLAETAPFDPAYLPYDQRVLDYLKAERARGRAIVLATASDRRAAQAVADHVGLFDRVFASDGKINLKARRKATALASAFPQGFVYAGNEAADLKVWSASSEAVVVNAPKGLVRKVARTHTLEHSFPRETSTARALIKAIRPQQWAKNVLVFLPMLAGQGWLDPAAWRDGLIAFFAISMAGSCLYIINDASDIDAGRVHARKRRRPFAAGALSPAIGIVASVGLFAGALALGQWAGAVLMVGVYLATSAAYTFWFKRVAMVDVFLLGALYTIRVVLGGVATGYIVSQWLLAFCCFFFLALALVKRAVEVDTVAKKGGVSISRRGYLSSDGPILKMMGVSASFVSALVLSLYTQSPEIVGRYQEPFLLWVLPAAIVFWLCRVWLIADRGDMHDDPLVFAFRDRTSWAIGAVIAAAFAAAVLLPSDLLRWK